MRVESAEAAESNDGSGPAPREWVLYLTVASLLICAIALGALLGRTSWSTTASPPARFLGLDEPVHPSRGGR